MLWKVALNRNSEKNVNLITKDLLQSDRDRKQIVYFLDFVKWNKSQHRNRLHLIQTAI